MRLSVKSIQLPGNAVKRHSKWDREAFLFLLPYLGYLTFFVVYPFYMAISGSLSDWDILSGEMKFRGLYYYGKLLQDSSFYGSLKNSLVYWSVQVPPSILFGLGVAVLLNQPIHLRAAFRSIFFMPVVTPIVTLAVVWAWLYQSNGGLINTVLSMVGIPPIPWLTSESWSMPSIGIMKIWTDVGFYSVLFLAALQQVPNDLIDAAKVDGANAWQIFINVKVPILNPTIVFALLMGTIWGMQIFTEPFLMTGGGPLGSSRTVILYMYEVGFIKSELSYGSAIGVVTALIILAITLVQKRMVERNVSF